jgi:hypothetical protein
MIRRYALAALPAIPSMILTLNMVLFALFGIGFLPEVSGDGMALACMFVWLGGYVLAAVVFFNVKDSYGNG